MTSDVIEALARHHAQDQPVVLVTDLASGEQTLHTPDTPPAPGVLRTAFDKALRDDRCSVLEHEGREMFLHVFNPRIHVVVVGAVHIAQALIPMVQQCGFVVTVVDPRSAFAASKRFPDVMLLAAWPDEALPKIRIDARTAVITLTHDPKIDDPALSAALRSEAFYVGALGSRKTHAARLKRLRQQGFDDAALQRIHGPAGLALGATSPAEIALSVAAQLVEKLRHPS